MGERVSTDMVAIGCALSSEVSHDIAHTRRKIPGYRESTAVRARDSSLPSCTTRWIDQDYHDVAGRYLTHWAHWAHSSYRYPPQHTRRRARGGGSWCTMSKWTTGGDGHPISFDDVRVYQPTSWVTRHKQNKQTTPGGDSI
jgi:hypothetical protein